MLLFNHHPANYKEGTILKRVFAQLIYSQKLNAFCLEVMFTNIGRLVIELLSAQKSSYYDMSQEKVAASKWSGDMDDQRVQKLHILFSNSK